MTVPDFAAIFDDAPAPLLLLSRDLEVVHANHAWRADTGVPASAALGRPVAELLRDEAGEAPADLLASLERVRETGRPDTVTVRSSVFRTVPVIGADGELTLLLHRSEDVGDRVRDLRATSERERRSARTLAGLASAAAALGAAESRADLLTQLFRHGGPAFGADALAVALLDPDGSRLTVVDTSRQPVDHPVGHALALDSPLPIAVAATGRPDFQPDADAAGAPVAPLPGLRAWAALPLHAGQRPLGSLTIGWREPRTLDADEIRVLEAFAAQCAAAVGRVGRRETERRKAAATRGLAEVLQRSMLTDPPQPDHLDIAVRYRPAAREAQVGGDWYDAFPSPAGTVTVAVGDVTGHDRTAAAVAGQLRSMLRGIVCALDGGDPARALGTLDRALHDTGATPLATALVAHVAERPAPHGAAGSVFTWSNAGHPPPLLIRGDGTAMLLEHPSDLLLGVEPGALRRHHSVALNPGDTVVLYTDGLIERRDANLDDGLARLVAAAPDLADRTVDEACHELVARLDPELTDDIALLAVRVR